MVKMKICPYCGGKHRKRSAWLKCAKKHDPKLSSWPKFKGK